jgi:hypothetical protein
MTLEFQFTNFSFASSASHNSGYPQQQIAKYIKLQTEVQHDGLFRAIRIYVERDEFRMPMVGVWGLHLEVPGSSGLRGRNKHKQALLL